MHTIPSTWVNKDRDDLDLPYRRIVGISPLKDGQDNIWVDCDLSRLETYFDKQAVSSELIELDEILSDRLVGFFRRYFVEPQRTRPFILNGTVHSIDTETYNCHLFGYWMSGMNITSSFYLPDEPENISNYGRLLDGNAKLGQHAVLSFYGDSIHSVVGLGEDNDSCLQVIATNGHIGIDTYENVVDQHDYMRTDKMQFYVDRS